MANHHVPYQNGNLRSIPHVQTHMKLWATALAENVIDLAQTVAPHVQWKGEARIIVVWMYIQHLPVYSCDQKESSAYIHIYMYITWTLHVILYVSSYIINMLQRSNVGVYHVYLWIIWMALSEHFHLHVRPRPSTSPSQATQAASSLRSHRSPAAGRLEIAMECMKCIESILAMGCKVGVMNLEFNIFHVFSTRGLWIRHLRPESHVDSSRESICCAEPLPEVAPNFQS